MSNPPDIWTEEEKTFLLTEIIKRARIPPSFLYNMIQEQGVSPAFMEIPLPPGRSVIACQNAYDHMSQEYGNISQRQRLSGPTAPLQISPGDRKRPPPFQVEKPPAGHRAIQPKPIPPGRYPSTDIRTPQQLSPNVDNSLFSEPPRKRGRPSKAEIQRRNQLAQARGDPYPPVNRHPPRFGVQLAPSLLTGTSSEPVPFSSMRPQVMDSHAHGGPIQPTDAFGSQTQDIRVHRAPRSQISPSSGAPVSFTPNSEPGEPTPRATIENQASHPTTSLIPSSKVMDQSSSLPDNPKPETPLTSSAATVEHGKDISPALSAAKRESAS
ncbi:AT hook domain-containing protein [Histoplasma ohiense]|nr:AT hook domain-containing protein [Histoplasma ohiense (nom. inval.)]